MKRIKSFYLTNKLDFGWFDPSIVKPSSFQRNCINLKIKSRNKTEQFERKLYLKDVFQGAKTSCVCVCTKRVCVSNTKPKACTVGIYST